MQAKQGVEVSEPKMMSEIKSSKAEAKADRKAQSTSRLLKRVFALRVAAGAWARFMDVVVRLTCPAPHL